MSDSLSFIANVIDQHLAWFTGWHRMVFFADSESLTASEKHAPLIRFRSLRNELPDVARDQPALEKVITLYEQIHTLARLVLIKLADGEMITMKDYDNVIGKHHEFMAGLRRLERAFMMASSDLDALTGLHNRKSLMDDLTREHSRYMRSGKPFCVAIMDIDHFKSINDSFGHDAGDSVLMAVANHVSRTVRVFDDVYRLGGEEFLMCLKEADIALGYAVIERLRSTLEQQPVALSNGKTIHVTASFGYAMVTQHQTMDVIINRADQALYQAKHEGRNRIVAAKP
jgi:diguanylate cyclase (GGDEF)-like protein